MALTRTFLSVAMQPNDITMVPASLTAFPAAGITLGASPQQPVWVQDELMYCYGVTLAGIVQIRSRGSEGQRAVFHDINSPVVTSPNPADFPALATGSMVMQNISDTDVQTLGSTQTISAPNEDVRYALNGTAAITVTLTAPTLAPNGIRVSFTSLTAFAHALTGATALFNNGAAGSPFTSITYPAQVGATVTLETWNGLYNVVAANGAVAYS